MRGLGVVCWLLLVSAGASAQVPHVPPGPPAHAQQAEVNTDAMPGPHALEASDLVSFLDGIVPLQLERSDVAGASVLVMQNGEVLLEKGYGYADLKSRKPVDPATTIFRLASMPTSLTTANCRRPTLWPYAGHARWLQSVWRLRLSTNPRTAIGSAGGAV